MIFIQDFVPEHALLDAFPLLTRLDQLVFVCAKHSWRNTYLTPLDSSWKKSLIRKNLMLFTSLLSKIFFSGSWRHLLQCLGLIWKTRGAINHSRNWAELVALLSVTLKEWTCALLLPKARSCSASTEGRKGPMLVAQSFGCSISCMNCWWWHPTHILDGSCMHETALCDCQLVGWWQLHRPWSVLLQSYLRVDWLS